MEGPTTSSRCNIVPDPQFTVLKSTLTERLAQVASRINYQNFASLMDGLMRQSLHQEFKEAGADEGSVWLVEPIGQCLVPVYNSGPNAARFVGTFRQPLSAGLISMVFASEQPFIENEVYRDSRQSPLLDNLLQVQTRALIAVPFYFLKTCRGVI